MKSQNWTLEEQRMEFSSRLFLATPLSGMIAWTIVGFAGLFLPDRTTVWVLFGATGCIIYLALFLSKFTGENFLDKSKPKNVFDNLFLFSVGQAVMMYAIAIPFFLQDHTSLPMTVGILTGAMWLPITWIVRHWVGVFHAVVRTVLVVALWYLLPESRFVAIPFAIVGVYWVTLVILRKRQKDFLRKLEEEPADVS